MDPGELPLSAETRRMKWLVAGFALVGLIAGGLKLWPWLERRLETRRVCEQLAADKPDERRMEQYFLRNGRRALYTEQLDPGKYRIAVTSDCYSAVCSFQVGDSPKPRPTHRTELLGQIECTGQPIEISATGWFVETFFVPAALNNARVHVRVERNGQELYDGVVRSYCTEPGFCVFRAR